MVRVVKNNRLDEFKLFRNDADYNREMASRVNNEHDHLGIDEKNSLGTELTKLYNEIMKNAQRTRDHFPVTVIGEKEKSRDNLLCYLTFRKHNLENLQMRLAEQGLSSLGRLEGHVINGVELVLRHFPTYQQFKGQLQIQAD